MNSFPNRLRMNNIFPTDQYNPLGPPPDEGFNIDEMSRVANRNENILMARKKADQDHQIKMMQMQQSGQLGNIANQALSKNPVGPTKPMDVIYQPNDPLAMKHRELNLKEKELAQKGNIANRGLDIKQGDSDIRQQIADLRIPESEKLALMQKYGLAKIDATGQQNRQTLGMRGEQNTALEGVKQTNRAALQTTKGNQQLSNIAANITGRTSFNNQTIAADAAAAKLKADALLDKPMIPSQTRIAENNAARQLMGIRPDLAKFIVQNESGDYIPVSSGDPATDELIKKTIYPEKKMRGVQSGSSSINDTRDQVKKPVSKYSVTVK